VAAVAEAGGSKAAGPESESAILLRLAKELKVEVDKTNRDVLSIRVVRKAQEIEELTRKAQREMKPAVAAN
jgi:hypothetical protein